MILFISACLQNSICFKYFEEISYSDTDIKSEQDLLHIPCSKEKQNQQTTKIQDLHWEEIARIWLERYFYLF